MHFQGCTSISPMFCLDGYYSEIVVLVALGRREEAVERVKQYSVQLFAMLQVSATSNTRCEQGRPCLSFENALGPELAFLSHTFTCIRLTLFRSPAAD